jgi:hypothetical protein
VVVDVLEEPAVNVLVGPRNGSLRYLRWLRRAFRRDGGYIRTMKSSRAPFVTAVYEECAATRPAAEPLEDVPRKHFVCDLCGKDCEGLPSGSGLLLWSRGDELRIDEPPLCEECASRVTIGAVAKWALEGEEEG